MNGITEEDVREWCYKRGLTIIDNALYREMWNRWSASVQRWIPCSERLPENSRTVLVTDWGETCVSRRYDGRWWDCDGNVLKDVSAWMDLPNVVIGKDDNEYSDYFCYNIILMDGCEEGEQNGSID